MMQVTPSTFPGLRLEARGAICQITLSRPEVLNRFDDELHHGFTQAMEMLRDATETRAVVLASEGKVFSAGGDFDLMRDANADPATRRATVDGARRLFAALMEVPQPIVVALNGAAIGLGATVALACDAIVAHPKALLADTHVNVGLVAGDGGCLVWPAAVGMLRARRHLLTGEPVGAQLGYELGLITDLVDTPEEVLPAAFAIAERIAALPPLAVQGTKRVLNRMTQQRAGEMLDLSLAYEEATLASADLLEGIAAFEDKRAGDYQGR